MSRATPGGFAEITPATDEEKAEIWSEFEIFRRTSASSGDTRLHLPDGDGGILGNKLSSAEEADLVEKAVAVYPVGYREVCPFCLEKWRADDA